MSIQVKRIIIIGIIAIVAFVLENKNQKKVSQTGKSTYEPVARWNFIWR